MDSRIIFTLLFCAGISVCPIPTSAQAEQKIDLQRSIEPIIALPSIPILSPTAELSARERIIQRRLQYRQRRIALRKVSRLRRFAKITLTKTIDFWAVGKGEQRVKLDSSKSYLPIAPTESQKPARTITAELEISHPIGERLLTWRIRATHPGSKVSWDKARNELRGIHGAQLIYVPGRSNMATLTADRVVLDQRTGQARAEGNVRLERDGQTWAAHHMTYNFRTKRFDRVHFRSPHKDRQMIDEHHHADSNPTIQAAQIDVPTDTPILFHNAAQHKEPGAANILGNHELSSVNAPVGPFTTGGDQMITTRPVFNDDASGSSLTPERGWGVLSAWDMNSMWKERHLRFSFEEIDMPAAGEQMGLFGVGVHEQFNDWLYGGLSAYGAATGQRGGFFTGGFTVGAKKYLGRSNWLIDAGIYAGAGGGGSAPQGGGLMLRPHLGLMYDFGRFSLGINYAKVKFPNGDIDSDGISVMFEIPFSSLGRNWDDPPTRADEYFGIGLANVSKHRSHISMRSRAYKPAGGSKKTSGQSLTDTIGLVGVEYAYFLDDNWFINFETAGAMKGGVDGYAELLGGVGYRLPLASNDRWALLPSLSLGGAGGGGVDTGGGFVTRANLGLEYRLSRHMSLILDGGYLVAPDGNFETPYAGLNLAYVMESFAEDQKGSPITADDIVQTSKWRIRPAHQWYLDAQRKSSAARDMQVMGAKLDWMGGDWWYLTGQALSAYAGGAGGYSEGHWGGGLYGPSWKNAQVYAEMLVGAGGGGGVDTGSALLFKPSVGLEFQLTPKFSLQTGLGKVFSNSGNLDSNFLEANLVYRFGSAYR